MKKLNPKKKSGGFVVEINYLEDYVLETPVFHFKKDAIAWADNWIYWSDNFNSGKVDSIYYIVQVPDTWNGPPKGAHAYSGLYVKIGTTKNVMRRLSNLQTGTFGQLIINALEPGGLLREKELHEHFASDRRKGEWFICSPALYQHIFSTWFQYRILPKEHQYKVLETLERADIYSRMVSTLGSQPTMVNPSINEDWQGSVLLDLVYSNIVRK